MSKVSEQWGRRVAERGFAQVPNYLLLINRFLDPESSLSALELLVLIQLVGTWWNRADKPFPSIRTLALRCGVSDRQMQRTINALVEVGLLKRIKRRTKGIIASNAYDMEPLVDILATIAEMYPNEYPRSDEKVSTREILGS